MFNNKKPKNRSKDEFQPPELPIGWIASTFIGPTIIAISPQLFSSDGASFSTSLIIALVLLSISLLVICFSLVLRLYNASYSRQVLEYQMDQIREEIVTLNRANHLIQKADQKVLEFQEQEIESEIYMEE